MSILSVFFVDLICHLKITFSIVSPGWRIIYLSFFSIFKFFLFLIIFGTEKVHTLDLDLVVKIVHRLLDFELLLKQNAISKWCVQWYFRRGKLLRRSFMFYVKYGDAFWMFGSDLVDYFSWALQFLFPLVVFWIVSFIRAFLFNRVGRGRLLNLLVNLNLWLIDAW